MGNNWRNDLSDSAHDFLRVVWPVVSRWCKKGRLYSIEEITNKQEVAEYFDTYAGINAFQIVDDEGIRGIASRVQYGTPYASFTVRKTRSSGVDTEWAKRLRALRTDGFFFPDLTVQAYLSERRTGYLLYVAMIKTKDLYRFADDKYENRIYTVKKNSSDGNEFAVFWVEWLRGKGVEVKTWCHSNETPRGPKRLKKIC